MPSTFSTLEIGKSALMAARRAIDVTGHNVANAATPGYSRQEVILEPIVQRGLREPGASGMGVRVSEVRRYRDEFLGAVLRGELSKKAAFEVQKDVLEHLQVLVAEPSDEGLHAVLDSFWAAWQDLSSEPDSAAARAQVMEQGRTVADTFRHLGSQLDSLLGDIEAGIDATLKRVNSLAQEVAFLNVEITRAKSRGEPYADLADRRDLLVDELAELTGASVAHLHDTGSVRVAVGGVPLVEHATAYRLDVVYTSSGTEFRWSSGGPEYVIVDGMGGKLGGYKDARDVLVRGFKDELEALASSIVGDVNAIHSVGYPISGAPGDFFVFTAGDVLGSVRVREAIVNDPWLICASRVAGDPLDGQNALAIAKRLDGSDSPSEPSFTERWMAQVGRLGSTADKIANGFGTEELLVKELQNRMDSISGVSVDEEVANLIRYEHAFAAASRLITVADEMLDTLINRMGRA